MHVRDGIVYRHCASALGGRQWAANCDGGNGGGGERGEGSENGDGEATACDGRKRLKMAEGGSAMH
jgi:hypothetical protein